MKGSMFFAGALAAILGGLPAGAAVAGPGHGSGHAQDFAGGHPGKASEVDRTVTIAAGDIHFDRKRVEVRAGQTIRFVVTNTGAINHDFTLGTPAVQRAHRKEMAELMSEGKMHQHGDPNAMMLEPSETRELIWTFEEADAFLFGCNVPGHFEAGMKGDIAILGGSEGEELARTGERVEQADHGS